MAAYAYINGKGKTYYLHSKLTNLRSKRKQRIFYFARVADPWFSIDKLPDWAEPVENTKGVPMLREKKVDGERND